MAVMFSYECATTATDNQFQLADQNKAKQAQAAAFNG